MSPQDLWGGTRPNVYHQRLVPAVAQKSRRDPKRLLRRTTHSHDDEATVSGPGHHTYSPGGMFRASPIGRVPWDKSLLPSDGIDRG